jgi:hypothetical protein
MSPVTTAKTKSPVKTAKTILPMQNQASATPGNLQIYAEFSGMKTDTNSFC